MINKDQIAGAAKTALGKTQEAAGRAIDEVTVAYLLEAFAKLEELHVPLTAVRACEA